MPFFGATYDVDSASGMLPSFVPAPTGEVFVLISENTSTRPHDPS